RLPHHRLCARSLLLPGRAQPPAEAAEAARLGEPRQHGGRHTVKRTARWLGRSAVAVVIVFGGGAAGPAPTVAAPGTVLYVDGGNPNCSNTGQGAATQPYCTIQKGASVATAGMTVQVAAGTYAENVSPWNSGAAGAPIVLAGAPGATVTGAPAGSNGFTISGKSYITIQGFTIANTVGSVISAYN